MINKTQTDSAPTLSIEKYTTASCCIAAYFILSSFVYFFNPLRFTEEIHAGFYGFILGFGNVGEVIDEYFADYSIMTLIGVVAAVWTAGLAVCLAGIILSRFKRTQSFSHWFLFTGGLALLVASLISVIGAGYYSAVDSDALKGMIFVDMPLGAMIGFPAAGAICASSGWVIYESIGRYLKESRQKVHTPGRLRALSYDESRPRSYIKGIAGALLGVLIGGLPWIILIVLDVFGAFFGISIGLLVRFFYGLMGGKDGRIKNIILFAAAILGVPIIEILGYSAQIAYFILSGEIVRRSFFDLWGDMLYNITANTSLVINLSVDTGVGILFAAICVSGVFSRKKTQD